MTIFVVKSMPRQCKLDGLFFEVDLCFLVHKLVEENDEDGHYEEKDQIRQMLIENPGFIVIRINRDVKKSDLDVEIARIYNYIKESSVELVVNSTEKSLKERFAKESLSYLSNISNHLKHINYFIKKLLPTI